MRSNYRSILVNGSAFQKKLKELVYVPGSGTAIDIKRPTMTVVWPNYRFTQLRRMQELCPLEMEMSLT